MMRDSQGVFLAAIISIFRWLVVYLLGNTTDTNK